MNKLSKARQQAIKDMRAEGMNVSVLKLDTATKTKSK